MSHYPSRTWPNIRRCTGTLIALTIIGLVCIMPAAVRMQCLLSGVKRTWVGHSKVSANDPKRTSQIISVAVQQSVVLCLDRLVALAGCFLKAF